MNFLLAKLIVAVIHFCTQKRVEDITTFFKINNALVKNFTLVN